jgi:hypothetical protein
MHARRLARRDTPAGRVRAQIKSVIALLGAFSAIAFTLLRVLQR